MLVASKAYGVTRAAAVPRLLPEGLTLVKANARISLAGSSGSRSFGAAGRRWPRTFGSEWSLRYAFVVFVVATVLAILLPRGSTRAQGEERVHCLRRPERDRATGRAGGQVRGQGADPARSRSRCAPTAARAGSRAS